MGLTMTWNYVKRVVHITMTGYAEKTLHHLQHNPPTNMQHQPHKHVPQNYGTRAHYAILLDDYKTLNKEGKKFIMQVNGIYFYYARMVYGKMLTAMGAIASEKSVPTERTMKKFKRFLYYEATQTDAILTYRARNTVIDIHRNASHLKNQRHRVWWEAIILF